MGILSFLGCNEEANKSVYNYNSEEYHRKIKEFNISIDEAAEIASNFFNKNGENNQEIILDIVYDDFFIFKSSVILYNHKAGKYSLSGIWVNGKTSVVLNKKTKKYIKTVLKIPFTNETRYFKE